MVHDAHSGAELADPANLAVRCALVALVMKQNRMRLETSMRENQERAAINSDRNIANVDLERDVPREASSRMIFSYFPLHCTFSLLALTLASILSSRNPYEDSSDHCRCIEIAGANSLAIREPLSLRIIASILD